MAKIFRNYNTLAEYEADTNKPVNTVCFIKDAKVIYVDGIQYSYKQLDYLPPAITEAEALEYMGKIVKNAQEVGLIYVKPSPYIYWVGPSNTISISGTNYTADPDKITIGDTEYYQVKLDKDLDDNFYKFENNTFSNLIFKDVDTNKITNMGEMFGGCSALTTLDLGNFDISKVTNMQEMFKGCSALKTIRMVGCSQTTIDKIKAQLATDGITDCTIVTE